MLREVGCDYVIVGHSERRQFFAETDETVNRRLRAVLGQGMKPIFCIGETLREREGGKAFAVMEQQVEGGLRGLQESEMEKIVAPRTRLGHWDRKMLRNRPRRSIDLSVRSLEVCSHRIAEYRSVWREALPGKREGIVKRDIDSALVGGASLNRLLKIKNSKYIYLINCLQATQTLSI
jgi:triosephosphate isomerase